MKLNKHIHLSKSSLARGTTSLILTILLGYQSTILSHSQLGNYGEVQKKTILVSVSQQTLFLTQNGSIIASYPVSTSAYGIGNLNGSHKTPLGWHQIKYKIGYDAPLGQIFKATRNTGDIANIHVDKTDVEEDLVLTRVLWLDGLEEGVNKGGVYDSFKRHIYIHGTNEEGLIGTPASHGCVRMKNRDIITLFAQVTHYDKVLIVE